MVVEERSVNISDTPGEGNLAELLLRITETRPDLNLRVGPDQQISFIEAMQAGVAIASELRRRGVEAGSPVVIAAENSLAYLLSWIGCQIGAFQTAHVNPNYPADLLREMIEDLGARVSLTGASMEDRNLSAVSIGIGRLASTAVIGSSGGTSAGALESALSGLGSLAVPRSSIAGYMHTSGTTGRPKWCAQSHRYFISLGRFYADTMCLTERDRVYTPLPLFHINPFGYGFLGAISGLSDFFASKRFSVSRFWAEVVESRSTVLTLHAPPIELLLRRTTRENARGHQARAVFYADTEFMERFDIPLGVSCYGSTEAGGLCHVTHWRRGEDTTAPEGAGRVGGLARAGFEWDLTEEGEILIRADEDLMSSGYLVSGRLQSLLGPDGWFHTGDFGRHLGADRLVFTGRRTESLRVKGEFVPVEYVERVVSGVGGVGDVALWRLEDVEPTELGDVLVLYAVAQESAMPSLLESARALPSFMRPTKLVIVEEIPRDKGAGKAQRRLLSGLPVVMEAMV